MPKSKQSATNECTTRVLKFLYDVGCFAWRQNVLPIFDVNGVPRPGSKKGQPDIVGIFSCPRGDTRHKVSCKLQGRYLGIEIKTGKDKIRPEQEGFHAQARKLGGIIFVVKDYDDFLLQWNKLINEHNGKIETV